MNFCCREDEEAAAALNAYQREFEEDHSWEQLQEDEFGRLVALVKLKTAGVVLYPEQGMCPLAGVPLL